MSGSNTTGFFMDSIFEELLKPTPKINSLSDFHAEREKTLDRSVESGVRCVLDGLQNVVNKMHDVELYFTFPEGVGNIYTVIIFNGIKEALTEQHESIEDCIYDLTIGYVESMGDDKLPGFSVKLEFKPNDNR